MNIDCPGKHTPEWKKLASELGEEKAYLAYFRNGNKIPTPEEAKGLLEKNQTETPAFKKWFGGSKVVDEAGKPKLVYHGTADYVTEFDLDHPNRKDTGWLGTGVYVTTDPELASSYSLLKPGMDRNVMPLFASLKNPYYATLKDKQRLHSVSHNEGTEAGRKAADQFTADLKAKGHDGVILNYEARDVGEKNLSSEMVIFDPKMVKSATGNRGSFDPKNPDIRFQKQPAAPESGWVEDGVKRDETGKFQEGLKFQRQSPPIIPRDPNTPYGEMDGHIEDPDKKPIEGSKNPVSAITAKILASASRLHDQLTEMPQYTPFKKLLNTWNGNLQWWAQKANGTSKETRKRVPDRTTRNALSRWIEAEGDAATLQAQSEKSKPSMKPTYEAAANLSEDERVVAGWISDKFKQFLAELQDRDMVDEGVENYFTHIWKRPDNPTRVATMGKLVSKFKFAKKRSISSLFEGEQLGLEAQTTDAADVLAVYISEMGKAIETRDFIKALTNTKAADGRPLAVIEGSGNIVEGGEGGTGKHYIIDGRKKNVDYTDYNREKISHPALRKWKWVQNDENGNPILYNGDLTFHPDIYEHMKNVLGKSGLQEWYRKESKSKAVAIGKAAVRTLDALQRGMKQSMMAFSGFHPVQIGTHALGHHVNPLFGFEEIDLEHNEDQHDATCHALELGVDYHAKVQMIDGLAGGPMLYKIPGIGRYAEILTDWIFQKYIPQLAWKTYKKILEDNKRFYKKHIDADPAFLDHVKYLTARQVNNAYGYLNLADLGRNPTIQHILRSIFLAPVFNEARWRFQGQAVAEAVTLAEKGARKAFGKEEDPGTKGAKAGLGYEQLMAMATLGFSFWIMACLGNKAFSDDHDWHFDVPFGVTHKKRIYGMRMLVEDDWKLLKNQQTYISGRMSPIVGNLARYFFTHKDFSGRKQDFKQWALSEVLGAMPIATQKLVPGAGNRDIDFWQAFLSTMGGTVSRYSPAQELYAAADGWKKKHDIPIEDYPPSQYRDFRNALSDDRFTVAKNEYDRLVKDRLKQHPDYTEDDAAGKVQKGILSGLRGKYFSGSADNEPAFLKSLTPIQRAEYDQAIAERAEMADRFEQFIEKYHRIGIAHGRKGF